MTLFPVRPDPWCRLSLLLLFALGLGAFVLFGAGGCSSSSAGAPHDESSPRFSVLVFSKTDTAGYRHASIPDGIEAIRTLDGWQDRAWQATELYDAVGEITNRTVRDRLDDLADQVLTPAVGWMRLAGDQKLNRLARILQQPHEPLGVA